MRLTESKSAGANRRRRGHLTGNIVSVFVIASLLSTFAGRAKADPVTYTFTATGTGTIGGIPFANALLTISLFQETTNVQGGADLWWIENAPSAVGVMGAGAGAFTTPKKVFRHWSYLGFAQSGGYDLLDLADSSFGGYSLTNSFPLITHLSPQPGTLPINEMTTIGTLSLTGVSDVSFQATVGDFAPPQILAQPTNQTTMAGNTATLSVQLAGSVPLAFSWQQNGSNVPAAVDAVLSITNAQASNAGDYDVVVTNLFGAATSHIATIAVTPSKPVFTRQPSSLTSVAGATVSFTAAAKGSEPISWQWYRNGNLLSNATNNILSNASVQSADAGDYVVVATNQFGIATSEVATLTVITVPVFTQQPQSRGAPIGATVTFSAAAQGPAPLTWTWYSNGIAMVDMNSTALTIKSITSNTFASYWAVVTNTFGSATSQVAALEYSPVIAWGNNSYGQTNVPAGTGGATAVTGGDGHVIVLRSDGQVICWGYDNNGQADVPSDATDIVSIAAGSTHSLAARGDGVVKQWGSVIFTAISNAPPDATNILAVAPGPGAQHAVALRSDGTVYEWANLYYLPWVTPAATNPPPTDATNVVSISSGAFHSLALRGDGTLVAWGDNSSGQLNIPSSASNVVAISSGWYHNLALRSDGKLVEWGGSCGPQDCPNTPPTTASNIVRFACGGAGFDLALRADGKLLLWGSYPLQPPWATNLAAVGAGSHNAYALVASGPPVISLPLPNRSVTAGRSAYFYAPVVGAWPLYYQWRFNGINLTGATNAILVVSNALPPNAGVYSVSVSNAIGTADSRSITLTVLPAAAQIVAQSLAITNDEVRLQATSPPGYVWVLQRSIDLRAWSDVSAAVTNTTGVMSFSVPITVQPPAYFRLRLVP